VDTTGPVDAVALADRVRGCWTDTRLTSW